MFASLPPAKRMWLNVEALVVGLALAVPRPVVGQGGGERRALPGPQAQPTCTVTGTIRDSVTGEPLAGTTVEANHGAGIVTRTVADSTGRYALCLPGIGTYAVSVQHLGYRSGRRVLTVVSRDTSLTVDFSLTRLPTTLAAIMVTASTPVAIDVRSGVQTYQKANAHAAPTTTTSQILQQAVAGAARAPTGEVHIRGQHGEFTYYVDGVPVPAGVSGSLNELFDPTIASRIDLQTGGWDAEYGNKNIAVISVATQIPEGGFRWQASGYGGTFATNGQTVTASSNAGTHAVLLSLTRQETAMRREPLQRDPRTGAPLSFHNHGEDDFAFGKLQFAPSDRDDVTLDLSASRTAFQVPFDSTGGLVEDDHETDLNAFANLAWRHRFRHAGVPVADAAAERPAGSAELFTALYFRRGSLSYTPGAVDQPQFVFYPDTAVRYAVSEDRSATTTGVKADYTMTLGEPVTVKSGVDASLVVGHENFATRDALERSGPGVQSPVHGGDLGFYAQSVVAPSRRWELRVGMRLDHHVAPLAGDQHQLSPRVRLAYFPDPATSLWLYYGRLFIPSNVEDFHVLAAAALGGSAGLPTVSERDHYLETGVVHRFAPGILLKAAAYYRNDAPAVDDNTLPGTALTTTVNIARVHVSGIESALEWNPAGPLSGYLNAALSHASGHGPITGGFLPTAYPAGWFDQDHDQRLSVVASGDYSPRWGYVSATGIFGSGLTNGHPSAAPNLTGLLDFNPAVKVRPSFIVNASVGTVRVLGETMVRAELFVDNLFDVHYVLKGAFTSGPSIGRPRTVEVRVTVGR